MTCKFCIPVRDNNLWQPMVAEDIVKENFCDLRSSNKCIGKTEDTSFGEMIHKYHNCIKAFPGNWQLDNKIHGNLFLFPGRSIQRLEQPSRWLVRQFISLARVTGRDKFVDIFSHPWSVKVSPYRLISFINSQVPRVINIMVFLQKLCAQSFILWYGQMVPFLKIDPVFLKFKMFGPCERFFRGFLRILQSFQNRSEVCVLLIER